jgi:hypothetical protein
MAGGIGQFAQGFSSGFSSSFQNMMQARKFREQLGFEREKFDWQKTQDERNYQLQQSQLGLQKNQFGLQQQQFGETQKQDTLAEQHAAYHDKLEGMKQANDDQLAAVNRTQQIVQILSMKGSPAQKKAAANLLGQSLKIDPNNPTFKQVVNVFSDPTNTPESIDAAKQIVISVLGKGASAQEVNYAAKLMMTDPDHAMAFMGQIADVQKKMQLEYDPVQFQNDQGQTVLGTRNQAVGHLAPAKNPVVAVGPDGQNVYVSPDQATGLQAPSTKMYEPTNVKDRADRESKQLEQINTNYSQSHDIVQGPIAMLRNALDSDKFKTGFMGDTRSLISHGLEFFGVDTSKVPGIGDAASADQIESAANQLATNVSELLSRTTNLSIKLTQDQVANLTKTPQGNRMILELFTRADQLQAKMAEEANHRMNEYGTLNPPNQPSWFDTTRRLEAQNPVVDKDFDKRVAAESAKAEGVSWDQIANFGKQVEQGGGDLIDKGREILGGSGASPPKKVLTIGPKDNQIRLPVTRFDGGVNYAKTADGEELPVVWTPAEMNKFRGKRVIFGPQANVIQVGK